jgi:hypothetical protein
MAWLIPRTLAFPKSQRGVLARQVQSELFRIYEALVEAGSSTAPLPNLQTADRGLIRLRTYLRLCHELALLTPGQYEHASRLLAEVGRLLGGWLKALKQAKKQARKRPGSGKMSKLHRRPGGGLSPGDGEAPAEPGQSF